MWEAQPVGQLLDVSQTLHKAEKAGRLVVGLEIENAAKLSAWIQEYSVPLTVDIQRRWKDFQS